MEMKAFFSQCGAKFAEILNKVGPHVAEFSPQFLPAIALIASGGAAGTLSSLGFAITSVGMKVGSKVLDYPVNFLSGKAIDLITSKESGDSGQELSDRVAALCDELEKSSGGSMLSAEGIAQLSQVLAGSPQFIALADGIEAFHSKVDILRSELSVLIQQIEEERKAIASITTDLPTIETLLRKGDDAGAEFFRPEGPRWTDFEKGYIVESKVVGEIVKKLKDCDIVVLTGDPASGKSVIARNVGYRLASEERVDVYYVGLKTSPRAETLSEISKIQHGYIILDDAHLNMDFVQHLLLIHQNRTVTHARLIIAARDVDVDECYGPTSELLFQEYLKKRIRVTSSDVAGEIVSRFNEKRAEENRKVLPEKLRSTLAKNNLWVLAWQLKSFDQSGEVDEKSVCKTVKNYIETAGDAVAGVANAILLIAVFYEYEIPVRRRFIKFIINQDPTRALVKLGEIVHCMPDDDKDYLALCHSEVAKIYLRAFECYPDLGGEAKEEITREYEHRCGEGTSDSPSFSSKVFDAYFRKFPDEMIRVIPMLHHSHKDLRGLFSMNLEEWEEDPVNMQLALCATEGGKRLLGEICRGSGDVIAGELGREPSVRKIASCMRDCMEAIFLDSWDGEFCPDRRDIGRRFVEALDLDMLVAKIEKEEDAPTVAKCIQSIRRGSPRIARMVAERLDQTIMAAKIQKTRRCDEIEFSLSEMALASETVGKGIAVALDASALAEKVKSLETSAVGYWFSRMAAIDVSLVSSIASSLDLIEMVARIKRPYEPEELGRLIGGIADANEEVARRILRQLDLEHLKSAIQVIRNTASLTLVLAQISKADAGFAESIAEGFDVETLVSRLMTEPYVFAIEDDIRRLSNASKDSAKRVLEALDVPELIARLEREHDCARFGLAIFGMVDLDARLAERLIDGLHHEKIELTPGGGAYSVMLGYVIRRVNASDRALCQRLMDPMPRWFQKLISWDLENC